MLQRVKEVQESDLRMDGALARNIQRVLAVTQADIDAAAAQGKGWLVKRVVKVNDPLDNLRGGTQLVIKQNSILPGQNVMRVLYSGSGKTVGPAVAPLSLPGAAAEDIMSLIAFGGTEQNGTPTPDAPVDIVCNNGVIKYGQYGKNLFDSSNTVNGYINSSGNVVNSQQIKTSGFIKITPSTTYTISGTGNLAGASFDRYAFTYTSDKTPIEQVRSVASGGSATFTTASNAEYIRVQCLATNIDTCQLELGSAATTYEPYHFGLHTDGTVETINVNRDFFSRDGETTGQIINSNGTVSNNSSYNISAPFTLPAGDYTCTWTTSSGGNRPFSVFKCDANGNIILTADGGQVFYQGSSVSGVNTGNFTLDSTTLVRSSYRNNMTDLAIFSTSGTATAEMLLKIGDYQDAQSIIDGVVTRKVGVKVLDGTENVGTSNATFTIAISDRVTSKIPLICSHFQYSNKTSSQTENLTVISFSSTYIGFRYDACANAAAFKTWLTDQYAAGTPVIVIYQLATETTESVAGQPMQTAAGDNTAEITQAGMAGLELEVEYVEA